MVHAHPTSGGVRLRPFRRDDDAAAHAAHEALAAEGFTFLLGWAPSDAWGDYLDRLDERSRGVNVAPEWVPEPSSLPSSETSSSDGCRCATR